MDDIDDLLDEIERDFSLKETKAPGKQVRKKTPSSKVAQTYEDWDDDGDIADILDTVDGHIGESYNKKVKNVPRQRQSSGGDGKSQIKVNKCYPMYLGGTEVAQGLSICRHKKACDNIRCTSCDFKIVRFDDCRWQANADYLFFRNTMPDVTKLNSKLTKSKGCAAYCCQCSWKSIQDITAISKFKDLKWVCGKH